MSAAGAPDTTLVLQSHRQPLPLWWLEACLQSVRSWAQSRGYCYRFEDDRLIHRLHPDLLAKTVARPAVAADLGRLSALQAALAEEFETVVWLDADTLVFDPARFELPAGPYALGRELWVEPAPGGGVKTWNKVHNAFLMFRSGNPFLDFYRHAAERIVGLHEGPMVSQLVGPKLLTALHNLIQCPVLEEAAVLAPAVAADLLAGGGRCLDAFRAHTAAPPAVVNLCASLTGSQDGTGRMPRLIERLLADPAALRPPSL